jgi:hypothetical protein
MDRDTASVQVMVVNTMQAPQDVQERMASNMAVIFDGDE